MEQTHLSSSKSSPVLPWSTHLGVFTANKTQANDDEHGWRQLLYHIISGESNVKRRVIQINCSQISVLSQHCIFSSSYTTKSLGRAWSWELTAFAPQRSTRQLRVQRAVRLQHTPREFCTVFPKTMLICYPSHSNASHWQRFNFSDFSVNVLEYFKAEK